MNIENLIENVDQQIIKIRTKSLDVSFNELFDMYENDELVISPDYQRLFRWDEEKQSRFIESLILEMPVPPIFVIETDEGVYELIDGLQRISSYLHFRGKKLGECENTANDLVLCGCDIIEELNGNSFLSLPKALQIKLKRSFVRMEVIRKESEPSLKYHMFKRLNTGGELLTFQEIRNCTIRMLGNNGIDFIQTCSKNDNFKNCIGKLDTEKKQKLIDQELILRFFALKNDLNQYRYPVTEYLTNYLEMITTDYKNFNFENEGKLFERTFEIIYKIFNDEAFSTLSKQGKPTNNFANYLFDAVSLGIALNISSIKDNHFEAIKEKINKMKNSDNLANYKTGSVNGVKTRIEIFKNGVKEAIES
ncbi:MAG: DUF262 domain-containing protein [Lachnospiraceae bacterium]|nr:DUF262 domain-containing protein [Lachnospiraceae bacterium]